MSLGDLYARAYDLAMAYGADVDRGDCRRGRDGAWRAHHRQSSAEDILAAATLYLPPWRAEDSSAEYGPETVGAFKAACERFRESVHGGGLWSFDREPTSKGAAMRADEQADAERWLQARRRSLPEHVERVLTYRIRCRNRGPAIARRTGLALPHVEHILKVFEGELAKWRAGEAA